MPIIDNQFYVQPAYYFNTTTSSSSTWQNAWTSGTFKVRPIAEFDDPAPPTKPPTEVEALRRRVEDVCAVGRRALETP